MKTKVLKISSLVLMIGLVIYGCKKSIKDVNPNDELTKRTIEHYNDVMKNEGYKEVYQSGFDGSRERIDLSSEFANYTGRLNSTCNDGGIIVGATSYREWICGNTPGKKFYFEYYISMENGVNIVASNSYGDVTSGRLRIRSTSNAIVSTNNYTNVSIQQLGVDPADNTRNLWKLNFQSGLIGASVFGQDRYIQFSFPKIATDCDDYPYTLLPEVAITNTANPARTFLAKAAVAAMGGCTVPHALNILIPQYSGGSCSAGVITNPAIGGWNTIPANGCGPSTGDPNARLLVEWQELTDYNFVWDNSKPTLYAVGADGQNGIRDNEIKELNSGSTPWNGFSPCKKYLFRYKLGGQYCPTSTTTGWHYRWVQF